MQWLFSRIWLTLLEICLEEATPSTVVKPTGWPPPYRSGGIVIYGPGWSKIRLCQGRRKHYMCSGIHYSDAIKGAITSQITSLTIVYSTVYSDPDQRKTSQLRVTGLCARNSPETGEFQAQMKWPVMRKMFLFYYVIIITPFVIWSNQAHLF